MAWFSDSESRDSTDNYFIVDGRLESIGGLRMKQGIIYCVFYAYYVVLQAM